MPPSSATLPAIMTHKIPARIQVQELLNSRYGSLCKPSPSLDDGLPRPLSWDERVEGSDVVRSVDGQTVKLFSSAMQTPPQPGWVILLTDGDPQAGYRWTLYGMPRSQ